MKKLILFISPLLTTSFLLAFSSDLKDDHSSIITTNHLDLNLQENSIWLFEDPLDKWVPPYDFRVDEEFHKTKLRTSWQAFISDFQHQTNIRKQFSDLQSKYINIFNRIKDMPGADFFQLSKNFTNELMKWAAKQIQKSLNNYYLESKVAFVAFGSMARGESGPVTDLEGALVWDEGVSAEQRFEISFETGNRLARKLEGLIGHPFFGVKGFRLDEAEASPFHLAPWAKNLTLNQAFCYGRFAVAKADDPKEISDFKSSYFFPFEGSLAYATTATNLAQLVNYAYQNRATQSNIIDNLVNEPMSTDRIKNRLSDCDISNDEKNSFAANLHNKIKSNEKDVATFFRRMSRNTGHLFGNKNLYDTFKNQKDAFLAEQKENSRYNKGQDLALNGLYKLINDFSTVGKGMFENGTLPDVTDIKRFHYRLEEQILTNLSTLFNLEEQNSGDIILELKHRGFFGGKFANDMYARLNQINRLRWKEQSILMQQLPSVLNFTTKEAYIKKLNYLENEAKELENTISDNSKTHMEKLIAKQKLGEKNQLIKKLYKLEPLNSDSVLSYDEIKLLKESILPGQVELFKRLKEYMANFSIDDKAPRAFSDSFK